ncbi:hypothetical protein C8263_09220 [Deinococcus arcticus]|uniref:Uncharacterized protein n=2 Tax=Deinococcus arcticus TaxID=2136176 RepID=A0A2T3W8P9_9DEIO|nr:hypothetical protein C8263_09220 [Deinococcus arcticus]
MGAALLTGCGLIPTPRVDVDDVSLILPASGPLAGKVVYLERDALAGHRIPAALQQLTLDGQATYRTAALGTLRGAELYVRPALSALPASCAVSPATPTAPRMVVCDAAGEEAQRIGRLTLEPGQQRAFTLGGPALDQAARAGSGYFGLRFTEGQSVFGDSLNLSDITARARL